MKPSTSDKIFTPSSLPTPLLMAEGSADSNSLQPAFYKSASPPYEYKYKKVSHTPSIDLNTNLSGSKEEAALLYREQACPTNSSAASSTAPKTYVKSESQLASSAFDTASNEIPSTKNNNKALTLFMKSLLGEKAFHSISLLSVSFFISGMLLMFYLINLI